MDRGYQQAEYNQYAYNHNWYRIFRGYPPMSQPVKDMLYDYVKQGEHDKIMLFFMGHCEYDQDYSGFLLRELMRGNL